MEAAQALLHESLRFGANDGAPLGFLAAGNEDAPVSFGMLSPEGGRFAYLAVDRAVELALAGRVDAIVTAPLNKEALNLAGYHYAGHTDMLAALTKTRSSVMLLAHGAMQVGHVTTHVALADVPRLLTPERLRRTIDLTHDAVRDLGVAAPRLAVAALNPHAGEGGLFGRQDIEITTPVVEQCRGAGIDVSGPVPGDTVFVKLRARQFDAVVAMYHDQGHIPVKLLGFDVDPATGDVAGAFGSEHNLGPAGDPHIGGPRNGVRYRRQGNCQRRKPDRGDRIRREACGEAPATGLICINGRQAVLHAMLIR